MEKYFHIYLFILSVKKYLYICFFYNIIYTLQFYNRQGNKYLFFIVK